MELCPLRWPKHMPHPALFNLPYPSCNAQKAQLITIDRQLCQSVATTTTAATQQQQHSLAFVSQVVRRRRLCAIS